MDKKSRLIKVGSNVRYRGCFGIAEPKDVCIEWIIRSEQKRCKYGDEVDSVLFADREYCVFGLSDGHWCYGEQIDVVHSY